MSQFIKFYFTSSMHNTFRTLIHPSSGACDFFIVSPHWLCVLVSICVGVSVWLVGVVSVWQAEALFPYVLEFRCSWLEWYPCCRLKHCFHMCWSFGVAGWGGIRVAG